MKHKFFTRMAAITLGLAMAVGVSVGVANSINTKAVYATDNTANLTLTSKNNISATESFPFNVTYSGSWTWNSPQVRTTDESATVTFAGNSSVASIKSISIGCSSAGYAPAGSANNDYVTSVSSSTVTITGTGSSSVVWAPGAAARLKTYSITYEVSSAPTVSSVSVVGEMSKKEYTTVENWSNSGLTASGTMSDSSNYTGQFAWSYVPATPAAAVIANDGDEVTGLSVTATATAGGQHDDNETSGISVSYATVSQGIAAIPNLNDQIDGAIVKGKISYIQSIDTSSYYNATYFISEDGTRSSEIEVFRGKGVDNVNITNANYLKVGDEVVVYGDLKYYDGATDVQEFLQGNYLLSLERPASQDPSITISDSNFQMTVGDADVELHETHENVPDGGSIKWVSGTPAVATVGENTGIVHAVAAGTSVITAKIVDSGDNIVASNSITVTVVENALSDGDTFIVKATYSATTYYLTGVNNSNLGATSTTSSDAMVFTAVEGSTPGQFQLKNGNNYLSYSGSDNALYSITDDEAASTLWTAINNGTNDIIESANVASRKLQFNYNSGNNPRFACYTSSQTAIAIEKVTAPEVDSVTVAGDASANADDALSITKVFTYEVTYVDNNNQGNSAVTVSVLNSNSTTDGASVTVAPSNGEFSVTFTASDTYTITVTSSEDDTKSDSTTINVFNIHVPAEEDYNLYSGESLVESDYIFYYDGRAMKAEIASNRTKFETVAPVSNTISTEDASIVWHIAQNGEYYTIYNALEGKYLASTNSNNQAKLEATVTDNSRWSVVVSNGQFDFVNKARADASSNNKFLRCNNDYGFACYATGTGGKPSLYKRSARNIIEAQTTQTKLSYRYEDNGNGGFDYSDISIRFGGLVSKAVWDELDTNEHLISGFGVMITSLDSYVIKDHANEAILAENTPNINTQVVNHYMSKAEMATPVEQGDNYFWNLFFSVDYADRADIFVAAAYIKVGNEYIFMKQEKYSVETLAADYLNRRNYAIDIADGSLYNLAEPALA